MTDKPKKIKSVEVNAVVWTVDSLKELIRTNDNAVIRAMLKIYQYQTHDEQVAERTEYNNSVGFSGVDAEIMTSFAKWYENKKYLSPKQMEIARKKMVKYAGQLLLIMAGEQTERDK
jgi:hypothetical protein